MGSGWTTSLTRVLCLRRTGASEETFARWRLALLKDGKASLLSDEDDADALDARRMDSFDALEPADGFGLEHADLHPITPKYSGGRRAEQGIKIRQN